MSGDIVMCFKQFNPFLQTAPFVCQLRVRKAAEQTVAQGLQPPLRVRPFASRFKFDHRRLRCLAKTQKLGEYV
uniref:Uncharacterized protein n=1 Tax=Globodera rostochiensis TaxID=31243 RepID=A0A914HXU3_GLORO